MEWCPGNQEGEMLQGGGNDQLGQMLQTDKLVTTELVIRFGNMEVTDDKSGFSGIVEQEYDLWKE